MRYVGRLLVLLAIGWMVSCQGDATSQGPALSKEQIIPVFYDMMMVDEFANTSKMKDSTLDLKLFRGKKYAEVFRRHKIDSAVFVSSYRYYLGKPDDMKLIFDSLEAYATQTRIRLLSETGDVAAPATRDSLRKIIAQ